ncbi:unnamed protein product [Rotaria socialis]
MALSIILLFCSTSGISLEKLSNLLHIFLYLARSKPQSIPYQTKSCLKSSTCATEQILFCQNTTDNKLSKVLEYKNQPIIFNRYSYEFYIPNHLLKQSHECVIIAALNPHCFTVQLKQDAIEFDKFQREINDFYNELDDKQYLLVPEQIHANLCVMCADPKSSDNDKIWNRSQILDFDSTDNTVNLFYVDLGTWDEYVPINRLRLLIDCFHRHLVFSLTCRLAHVSPLNIDGDDLTWSNDATHQFLAVIDQVTPEIEFISFGQDGCFQTNLFVTNSGQYVCVNDYMIHIKKATAIVQPTNIDDDNQTIVQFDKNCSININPPIHPVIALYNQSGEVLKRSLIISRSASLNNSLMSSSDISSKSLVKVIHIHIKTHSINQQLNSEQKLPIIFIYYQNNILIPDFNICTLLKIMNSNIDIDTIQDYASAIKYHSLQITREFNSDVFVQIDSFVYVRALNIVSLYSIDFVHSILEYFHFTIGNVYLELEHAKYVQLNALDLTLWFKMNNELAAASSDNSMKKFQTSNLCLSQNIFHVQDEADFQTQVLDSKKTFLVNFHASWCGPCRILAPRLEKLITNYNNDAKSSAGDQHIVLAKVDVDKFEQLSSKFKVKAVPTVLAIKNGKEISRFTGLIDEDRIETMLDELNR